MSIFSGKFKSLGLNISWAGQIDQRILELNNLKIKGVESLIKKLKRAPDIPTFRDYWLENKYAYIFALSKLPVVMEPRGSKGPDILIKY